MCVVCVAERESRLRRCNRPSCAAPQWSRSFAAAQPAQITAARQALELALGASELGGAGAHAARRARAVPAVPRRTCTQAQPAQAPKTNLAARARQVRALAAQKRCQEGCHRLILAAARQRPRSRGGEARSCAPEPGTTGAGCRCVLECESGWRRAEATRAGANKWEGSRAHWRTWRWRQKRGLFKSRSPNELAVRTYLNVNSSY
jgi:hypothetical protein